MAVTEPRRRVTTKYMCGWCAMCPRGGKNTAHLRCPGYDEKTGKGCLCAAYQHSAHAKVITHQAKFNHVNEETIKAWWKETLDNEPR